MTKKRIEDVVAELAAPIVERLGFELVDVEFLKEGSNWYLRIYIDKPGGIAIDDCQAVSEEMSDKLDETDPIKQSYILEVSSPGLERPLKKDSDFEKYKGEEVEVKLFQPFEGKKIYSGELLGLKGTKICIKTVKGAEIEFERADAATVKRVIKF
ncbi:MAG: ribosome maturation factor RimP [Clostridiales bacterium]|nr:ribosome maturation factor RimP [Clostridiales bacterium]